MNATATRPYTSNYTQVLLEDEHGRVLEQYQEVMPVGTLVQEDQVVELVHHRTPKNKSRFMASLRAQWRKFKNSLVRRRRTSTIETRPLLNHQVVEVVPPNQQIATTAITQPNQDVLVIRQQRDVADAALASSLAIGGVAFIGICGLLLLLLLL